MPDPLSSLAVTAQNCGLTTRPAPAWLRTVLIDKAERGFVAASADSDYVLRPAGSPAPLTSEQLLQLAVGADDLPAPAAALPSPAPSADAPDGASTEEAAEGLAALERLLTESMSRDHDISEVSGIETAEGYLTVDGSLEDEYGYTMVIIDVASDSRDIDSFECEQDCALTTLTKEPGRHVTLRDTKGDPSDPILAERILTVVIDRGEQGFVAVSAHSPYDVRPPGSPLALTSQELLMLAEAAEGLTE